MILADTGLQAALDACADLDTFVTRAACEAQARGLDIVESQLHRTIHADPLGLARWSDTPPTAGLPQTGWLPVNILSVGEQLCVDWAYFGARALSDPFFEISARHAMSRPLNRFARHRTRLADLAKAAAQIDTIRPSGFVFHMSRCGSTLVAQMLASDPDNIVVSEASPLDTVIRLDFGSVDAHAAALAAMISLLCQRRSPVQAHSFIKLDSWHALALPLFRRAFPDVPWIFLYREPASVLASQMLERGIQTVPEYFPPELFGLTADIVLDPDVYCARVLSRTCEAVLEPLAGGGGMAVNYRELPDALWTRILPHFGIEAAPAERERMTNTAKYDAKFPAALFTGASDAKQELVTDALCATAERYIGDVYCRLEAQNPAAQTTKA